MNLLRLARLTAAVFTAASGLFLANVAQATDVVATKALDLGAGGQVGKYTSQAIVAGKPAVSYYDVTNGDLKFVRASNAAGTAWDAPVTIDSTGDVGQYASLVVVDGNPAVAYYDATNGDLKYVRATDATGSAWDSPVTLDSTGDVGQYISLAMVNGNPAVSYYDVTNEDLKFVRANDTSGSSWGAGAAVDSTGNVGGFSSLVVVNGYPAIAYLDATGGFYVLKYVRATDASGASWDAPVPVDGGGDAGFFVSLALVNGNPAISYQDVVAGDLKYVRSIDVNGTGTGWSSATIVTVDSAGSVGAYTSLATINSRPAISYYDTTGGNLKYAWASDANGAGWGTPAFVDTLGIVGLYTSLINLNGSAAISYQDVSNGNLNWATITTLPTVTSPTIANVASFSATLGGNVTADGGPTITSRGIVYAVTATNNNPQFLGTGVSSVTTSGTTGVFTVSVTGLAASTAYSYAAFATNSGGTSYTTIGTFTTLIAPPIITSTLTASGVVGTPFSTYSITATNSPTSFGATGLPGGLTVNTATGEITGTPDSAAGSPFGVTIAATNAGGTDTATLVITIGKAAQGGLSVSSSAGGTFGSGYTAKAAGGSGTGALSWSLGTGSTAPGAAIDATSGAVTSSGAGTVVVKVTKAADANYFSTTSADFTITLAKATQSTLAVTSSASGTFGSAYAATASGGSGTGGLSWALGTGSTAPGAAIDASSGAVTSSGAGTVVVQATKAGDANYFSASSADFTIALAKAAQAAVTVTSSASGTYGSAYTATAGGGTGTGGLSWALGTGSTAPGAAIDASTGAVTSTGAGTVVVRATKASDANYLLATSADFTITLAKAAQATVSITSPATGTFGVAYTATATGGNGTGAIVWALGTGSTASSAAIDPTTGAVTFASPGTVVFNATRAADANYNASVTTADFSVTVGKAAQVAVTVASPGSGTFGSSYNATAAGGSGTGAIAWNLGAGSTAPGAAINSSTGAVTSTGAGTVVINATKAGDANYLSATAADFTVTLAKSAQAVVSITSAATGTYGVAYTATASGGTGTGAIVWALGAGSTASGAAINATTGVVTFASTGTVVFQASRAGDANYNASAPTADFVITVGKASATVTLGSLTPTYDGTAHAATATTVPAALSVTYTYDGSATAPTSAGNYAVVGTINEPNYQGSATGTLTVAKAVPVITWAAPAAVNPGAILGATQLNATASTPGTFTYSPAAGTVLAGGFQTLTASFVPTDTANYTNATA